MNRQQSLLMSDAPIGVGSRVRFSREGDFGSGTVIRLARPNARDPFVVRWDRWPQLTGLYAGWELPLDLTG